MERSRHDTGSAQVRQDRDGHDASGSMPGAGTMDAAAGSPRRRMVGALGAIAAGAMLGPVSRAHAQAGWPGGKPVRIVIPTGPGAGADLFSRAMAEHFSSELGTRVLVDNKPGATGMLAGEIVARAPADGLTLLVSFSGAIVGNTLLMKPRSFEPLQDLAPIGRVGVTGNVLMVHPDVPARSVKELAEAAKGHGSAMNYATWGMWSGAHLAMEAIRQQTGMTLNHVPYKTVGQIPPDLISGVVPIGWMDAATCVPHVRSGRVRAIAVTSVRRMPQIPEVATLAEQGVAYDAHPVYGLFGPKGMPADLVLRINALLNRWLALPQTTEFFAQRQNMPRSEPLTPEQYAKSLQDELQAWTRLMQQAGFQPA